MKEERVIMDSKQAVATGNFFNSEMWTFLWVFGVSLWGGIVSYFERKEPFSWRRLLVHSCSASFAGMMTYFVCQAGNVPGALTGAICGLAAHMGTPALVSALKRLPLIKNVIDLENKEDNK